MNPNIPAKFEFGVFYLLEQKGCWMLLQYVRMSGKAFRLTWPPIFEFKLLACSKAIGTLGRYIMLPEAVPLPESVRRDRKVHLEEFLDDMSLKKVPVEELPLHMSEDLFPEFDRIMKEQI